MGAGRVDTWTLFTDGNETGYRDMREMKEAA
jgi:hypothetical protein